MTSPDYDYDAAAALAAATGTCSLHMPSHSGYIAQVESTDPIAGYLRRSYGTCPGTGCTFWGCDLFPSSPLPGHTHITSHTPKVRRHAVPLHAVQSHAPCRPSAGTGPSGRRALTREPMFVGTTPPLRQGSGDHRLVRH